MGIFDWVFGKRYLEWDEYQQKLVVFQEKTWEDELKQQGLKESR